ncbi:PilZ domain-containing protein [uncultured Sphingomonas sp.]|uniref:PilZ domain-containing protein n=1 Tax=uncultured Sphingomonas sp. TaxID=158754 RepID=UPI0035CA3EC0
MRRSSNPSSHWDQYPERLRSGPRRLVAVAVLLSSTAHGQNLCRVDNLSRSGCRVLIQCRFATETFLTLTFPGRSPLGARVIWSDGLRCGLEFLHPLHVGVLDDLLRLFQRPPGEQARESRDLASWQPDQG